MTLADNRFRTSRDISNWAHAIIRVKSNFAALGRKGGGADNTSVCTVERGNEGRSDQGWGI